MRARRRSLLQHGALHQRVRCLLYYCGAWSGDLCFLPCEFFISTLPILPTRFDGCVLAFHCIWSLVLLDVVFVVGVVFSSFRFCREGWFETLI